MCYVKQNVPNNDLINHTVCIINQIIIKSLKLLAPIPHET